MDPDANVKEQDALHAKIREGLADEYDRVRLLELERALDEWRRRGGFPPYLGWR